ncbi:MULTISPECIES: Tim44/TimA family putative adaptor protein [unclassified Epibacterium]|jgi:predicted lipid-binding transport protein (Tim44 family)|uniref:Tim44/TimA family putative adaptor protein n=1 Tax=unclassified Epibacterium TaxID=2639179 RepID=UPI001EF4E414|nr:MULTISPECIES: Tim44/TimA family putative adaptor protein [unclassified Epibacterium]MCG7623746.1 Tim44/TimA family putative adaptor protein [Epibacterium sp. Ofav1-8]MCG7628277.1 Tim44/TimA family putative adaptor protein [Epibacterium sp. MM17-32]
MESPLIELLVLAGIAVFLILRLKSVLGTREGFEKPPLAGSEPRTPQRKFEVIEGSPDDDIVAYVDEGSPQAQALAEMKRAEPSFHVAEFVQGARGAYEMILMGFETGELDGIQPFISDEIFQSFVDAVAAREDQGLTIEAEFIGVRETVIEDATFDAATSTADITVRFVGELTSAVRDRSGEIVEGDPKAVKRQKDTWTFSRQMGGDDPNWQLVATDA